MDKAHPLPREVLRHIISRVPLAGPAGSQDLGTLSSLRQTSRLVRETAEDEQPDALNSLAQRFVDAYLAEHHGRDGRPLARNAYLEMDQVLRKVRSLSVGVSDTRLVRHPLDLIQFVVDRSPMLAALSIDGYYFAWSSLQGLQLARSSLTTLHIEGKPLDTALALVIRPIASQLESLTLPCPATDGVFTTLQCDWARLSSLAMECSPGITKLSVDGLRWIGELPRLNKLEIVEGSLADGKVVALRKAMQPALRCLTLRNTTIGPAALEHLAIGEHPALEEVCLRRNRIGGAGVMHNPGVMHHLHLGLSRTVTTLNLASCRLVDEDLVNLLPTTACLKSLDLSRNSGLTSVGIGLLDLAHNATLTELFLNFSGVNDMVLQALALDRNTALRRLHVRKHNITPSGVRNLHLNVNSTLEELFLDGGSLLDSSAAPHFHLDRNTSLESLSLSATPFNAGVRDLRLYSNSTLRRLQLSPSGHRFEANKAYVASVKSDQLTVVYEDR